MYKKLLHFVDLAVSGLQENYTYMHILCNVHVYVC